ncbi:MAG: Fe-S cluster assembly ATPase SufC [Candidatus Magasanikbacteria bacterium]|nr:Fe-S cluster assembly ATPase SufC [Candidatus Magasanikbacteria bacterium]|tara:strand:- start:7081 stop:7821 length:741 start_codon:yes stop_codon:yes gene_type:complete
MSLQIKNLSVSVEEKEILRGIDLVVKKGSVVVIMGPNGSGKSTLANTVAGHPKYHVSDGEILLNEENITTIAPDERAKNGLFLSMQYIPEIEGVTIANFLRTAYSSVSGKTVNPLKFHAELVEKAKILHLDPDFLKRDLGVGFSGGERKRLEMLQLAVLAPGYAILDETDSGLDVDALRIVADGIQRFRNSGGGVVLITHYHKLLDYITPDIVHIMRDGKIIQSGGKELADDIEKHGYNVDNKDKQ